MHLAAVIVCTTLTAVMLVFTQVGEAYIYKRYYPGTEIERLLVPKELKKWKVDFPTYDPPTYTALCSGECDPETPEGIFFEQTLRNSSRKSWVSKYTVDGDNYPRNPRGRTGMAGRGSLSRWGPNHISVLLITRGQTSEEVLVKKGETNGTGPNFPTGSVDSMADCPFPVDVKKAMEADLLQHYHTQQIEEIFRKAKKYSKLEYRGYFPDEANTDNAWTELAVYTINDQLNRHIGQVRFDMPDSEYEWKQYDPTILNRALKSLIKMAEMTSEEKWRKGFRTTLWSVRNRGIGGVFGMMNDLVGNSLTLSGVVTTVIQLSG